MIEIYIYNTMKRLVWYIAPFFIYLEYLYLKDAFL